MVARSKPRSETIREVMGKTVRVYQVRRPHNGRKDRYTKPWKDYYVSTTLTHTDGKYTNSVSYVPRPKIKSLNDAMREAYVQAFDEFVDDLQQMKNSFGMTFAQMDKTFAQFAMYTDRVRKSYRHAKRGNVRKALQVLYKQREEVEKRLRRARVIVRKSGSSTRRDASSAILEWSYGIQPIMIEMENLRKRVEGDHIYLNASPRGRGFSREASDAKGNNGWGTESRFVRCKLQARIQLKNPNLALAESLGLLNPLLIVNDLIPFSFVVNYWTGHEKWLGSLTAFAGVHLSTTSTSYKVDRKSVVSWAYSTRHYTQVITEKSYSRNVDSGFYIPSVTDRFRIIPHMPLMRAINSAALLTSLLTKR